jgi:hypothetical protein
MILLRRTNWPIWALLVFGIPIALADLTWFRGCQCWYGAWENYKAATALGIVGFVAIRFVGAWVFKEQNNGWKYYLFLLGISPLVVEIVFFIAKLALPADLLVHP